MRKPTRGPKKIPGSPNEAKQTPSRSEIILFLLLFWKIDTLMNSFSWLLKHLPYKSGFMNYLHFIFFQCYFFLTFLIYQMLVSSLKIFIYLGPVYVITKYGMANLSHHNPFEEKYEWCDDTMEPKPFWSCITNYFTSSISHDIFKGNSVVEPKWYTTISNKGRQ